jgi:DNA polymerase-3 subunit delta
VLSEEEKDLIKPFCMVGMFIEDIISTAKRYPMMAERQVVIVKEAQDLSRTIDKLESYADNQWLYRFSDLLQVQNIR